MINDRTTRLRAAMFCGSQAPGRWRGVWEGASRVVQRPRRAQLLQRALRKRARRGPRTSSSSSTCSIGCRRWVP